MNGGEASGNFTELCHSQSCKNCPETPEQRIHSQSLSIGVQTVHKGCWTGLLALAITLRELRVFIIDDNIC